MFYLQLSEYSMHVTYVRMKDGREYMIPYESMNQREINKFVDGKVYQIDEFFDQMHNYYDEPTEEEIETLRLEYERTGKMPIGGNGLVRETPLDQLEQLEQEHHSSSSVLNEIR